MNPLLRLLAILAIGAGGTWFGMTKYQELKQSTSHQLDLNRIQREYLERTGWVNAVPDPDKYRDERNGLTRWYFEQLTEHYNAFPGFKPSYKSLADAEKGKKVEAKAGKKSDQELKQQYFDLTKAAFDRLKEGKYATVFTGTANSMRLDITKVSRVDSGGKPRLRFDLLLWGAQRRQDREKQAAGNTISRMVTAAQFTNIHFKFEDEKKKIFGEMDIQGDPEIKVDYPERWIEEFPAQAVIGYYEIDLLPSEPVEVEITFSLSSRSGTGSDIPASYTFRTLIDPSWKLPPGTAWEGANTEERSKDYIEQKPEK